MQIDKSIFRSLIDSERSDQIEKWGHQDHKDERWVCIALEELGEVSDAVLCEDDENLILEIVQVVAVLETWVTARAWNFKEQQSDAKPKIMHDM